MEDCNPLEPLASEGDLLEREEKPSTGLFAAGTVQSAIISLTAATMGSGVLALPLAISNSGLVLGVVLMFIGLIAFTIAYNIVVHGLIISRQDTYITMVETLLGSTMRVLLEIGIVIELFGVACAYQTVVVTFVTDLMNQVFGITGDFFLALNILVTILLCLGSMSHKMTALASLTSMVIVSIIYICLLVIVQTPSYVEANPDFWGNFQFVKVDSNIVDTITLLCFSFNSVTRLPMIYTELQNKSYKRMEKVVNVSLLLCTAFFILLGGFGYISYNYDMPGLVTQRPCEGLDWPMILGKTLFTIGLLANSMQTIYPLRGNIEEVIMRDVTNYSPVRFWSINYTTILLVGIVATLFPDAVGYFKILGGLLIGPIAILYPMLISWVCNKSLKFNLAFSTAAIVLSIIGFISVFNTIF